MHIIEQNRAKLSSDYRVKLNEATDELFGGGISIPASDLGLYLRLEQLESLNVIRILRTMWSVITQNNAI